MELRHFFEKFGVSKTYPKGTVLFKEGASASYALLIVDGIIQISKTVDDKQFVVALRSEGDIIGEMIFDGQPRSATATALNEVHGIYLASETFRRIVHEEPEVTMMLFTTLLRRLREATDQASDMALIGVYERVRKFLMSRLASTPFSQGDGLTGLTDIDANFQAIGNHVGASRDMISKIFKELIRGDYVKLDSGKIQINRKLPLKM
ncbi:MAG TPA: Crp/Fnr family transcriptional regulator [Limnobacter sp.]|uniref:Crp/Fnr family transcriptional regulator n=1 Tax=Limnobacter sp. TaxID=2003368 RepID=UPI002ED78C28